MLRNWFSSFFDSQPPAAAAASSAASKQTRRSNQDRLDDIDKAIELPHCFQDPILVEAMDDPVTINGIPSQTMSYSILRTGIEEGGKFTNPIDRMKYNKIKLLEEHIKTDDIENIVNQQLVAWKETLPPSQVIKEETLAIKRQEIKEQVTRQKIQEANLQGIAIYSPHSRLSSAISMYIAYMEDIHQSIKFICNHAAEIEKNTELTECFPDLKAAKQFKKKQKEELADLIMNAKNNIVNGLSMIMEIINACIDSDLDRQKEEKEKERSKLLKGPILLNLLFILQIEQLNKLSGKEKYETAIIKQHFYHKLAFMPVDEALELTVISTISELPGGKDALLVLESQGLIKLPVPAEALAAATEPQETKLAQTSEQLRRMMNPSNTFLLGPVYRSTFFGSQQEQSAVAPKANEENEESRPPSPGLD